jgi:hypothetical protein
MEWIIELVIVAGGNSWAVQQRKPLLSASS